MFVEHRQERGDFFVAVDNLNDNRCGARRARRVSPWPKTRSTAKHGRASEPKFLRIVYNTLKERRPASIVVFSDIGTQQDRICQSSHVISPSFADAQRRAGSWRIDQEM